MLKFQISVIFILIGCMVFIMACDRGQNMLENAMMEPAMTDSGSGDPDSGSGDPDSGSGDPDSGSDDPDGGGDDPDSGSGNA